MTHERTTKNHELQGHDEHLQGLSLGLYIHFVIPRLRNILFNHGRAVSAYSLYACLCASV